AFTDMPTAAQEDQRHIVTYDQEGQQYLQRQEDGEGAGQRIGQQRAIGPGQGKTGAVEHQRNEVDDVTRLLAQHRTDRLPYYRGQAARSGSKNEHLEEQRADEGDGRQQVQCFDRQIGHVFPVAVGLGAIGRGVPVTPGKAYQAIRRYSCRNLAAHSPPCSPWAFFRCFWPGRCLRCWPCHCGLPPFSAISSSHPPVAASAGTGMRWCSASAWRLLPAFC